VGTVLLPGFLLIFQLLTLGRVMFMFGWPSRCRWRVEVPPSAAGDDVVAAPGRR